MWAFVMRCTIIACVADKRIALRTSGCLLESFILSPLVALSLNVLPQLLITLTVTIPEAPVFEWCTVEEETRFLKHLRQ
jgi:hypothetical protein